MGKRRLKYYRVSAHENEHFSDTNRARSFGRCQLIQSYILEKTGKNRSRKQVSSHLQRLKKIHKDNPASSSCNLIVATCLLFSVLVRPFFSERPQLPSEHCESATQAVTISSQDIFANISFSTRQLRNDFDPTVDLRDTADSSPRFPNASEASSSNGGSRDTLDLSTNFHEQPSIFSPQEFLSPPQCQSGTLRPSDSDYLPELKDPLLCKDAMNGGFRTSSAFNTSAFSLSMRRLASRFPIQGRVDSGITTHFSRAVHAPAFQPTHQWISHDVLTDGICWNPPLISAPQLFHPPFHPLQPFPPEKQRLDLGLTSDWMWPQYPEIALGPREGPFSEYLSTMCQPNPTCPEMRVSSPGFHCSPSSESEIPQLQGISYSYVTTSPAIVSESVSADSAIGFPGQAVQESSEHLASPPMIRPTPVYPVSYIHSDDVHTSSSSLLPP